MKSALNLFLFLFVFTAVVFASALSQSASGASNARMDTPRKDSAILAYVEYLRDSINTADSTAMVLEMWRADSTRLADSILEAHREERKKK